MPERSIFARDLKQGKPFRSTGHEAAVGILRTADAIRRHLETVTAPYGITLQQYNVLRILRGARPEALPTYEIGERLMQRQPGITRLIDRLAAKGLVRRTKGASDRRQRPCSITPRGLALLRRLDPAIERADDLTVASLPVAEQRRFLRLLRGVRERFPG